MEGRDLRRTVTLSEQLAVPDSALRDFLRIHDDDDDDDDDDEDANAAAGSRNRTLIEMIRTGSSGGDGNSNGINWKPLKDRLRLRSAGNAWSSSGQAGDNADAAPPAGGATTLRPAPTLSRTMSRSAASARPSFSLRAPSSRVASAQDEHESQRNDEQGPAPPDDNNNNEPEEMPVTMSLMALLEQTDSQWKSGGDGRREAGVEEEDEEEENEEDVEGGNGSGMLYVCCVCMVRHKGAAFIPCGHTFCRLCSRELWVSRGNCPLCNGFIQEILDIF